MRRILRQQFPSKTFSVIAVLIFMAALTACNSKSAPLSTPTLAEPPKPADSKPPEPSAVPPTKVPTPTDVPTVPALLAEPQRVDFEAEDGKQLVGHYYPAASNPAPLVILMHWAGGDERDWLAIAPWLQNRPDELANFPGWENTIGADCGAQMEGPWLNPSEFPIMPTNVSFNVFTFTFRNFCGSESGLNDPQKYALDAKAAFTTGSELPGVDAHQIVAIGASIGADGAADGCLLHNQGSSTCLGAFSLSPGNYLKIVYLEVVNDLDDDIIPPEVPVWCLAAEDDTPSANTCRSASGDHYEMIMYDGNDHGMLLIEPDREPDPMELIQDFLEETLGG